MTDRFVNRPVVQQCSAEPAADTEAVIRTRQRRAWLRPARYRCAACTAAVTLAYLKLQRADQLRGAGREAGGWLPCRPASLMVSVSCKDVAACAQRRYVTALVLCIIIRRRA